MKTLTNYLCGKDEVNEAMNVKNIDDMTENDVDTKMQQLYDECVKQINKLDLGDFELVSLYGSHINFGLKQNKRSFSWGITYDNRKNRLEYDSISSYGSFIDDDNIFNFYRSVGIILSQKDIINKTILPLLKDRYRWDIERIKR